MNKYDMGGKKKKSEVKKKKRWKIPNCWIEEKEDKNTSNILEKENVKKHQTLKMRHSKHRNAKTASLIDEKPALLLWRP